MITPIFTASGDGTLFAVRVQPRARTTEIVGAYGDALKIRLQAPPVEGRANAALVAFLADRLGVSQGEITIVGGEHGRSKRIAVRGLAPGEVQRRLGAG